MGRVGAPKPVAPQVAPVVRAGRYAGYAIGVLNLDRVSEMIVLNLKDISLPQAHYVLLDKNGNVIVSSRPELRQLTPFIREEGQSERVEEGIVKWVPRNAKNRSVSEQWKKAIYFTESRIGGMAEWKLILEQPLAPFQQRMYARYTANLSWVFAILLAALAAAELVSRKAVQPIADLRRVSSDLPNRISSGTEIIWPESAITETEQLIYNFREMAQITALQFHHIRKMNSELEERIAKRTRELRESEERLNRAQRVAKVGSWEWNIATNELNWSDEVYRLYGADRRVHRPSYDIVLQTLAPECREAFTSSIDAALNRSGQFAGEYRIIALDGAVRYTHTVGEVVRDPAGRPVSMFGVVQEITERKQAENALRKSEERYRAIVENQVDFIGRYLAGGILTFVNESLARYVGMSSEELIGRSFYAFLHPGDREATINTIESLSGQNPSAVTENRAVLPDGSERRHQWTHSALFDADGKLVEYQSVGRDITESRQSEERIRQLANEQRVILDSVAIGIAYLKNRKFVWANPAFERICGYERGEYQGQDTRILYADDFDYERIGREGYARIASGASYTTEVKVVRKDGTLIWMNLTGRAVNPESPADGSIWLFQDITDRKRSEEALRERTHQLEGLTRDLEKMVEDEIAMRVKNEQILVQQSKMAAMGEMLGAIAHQWRQPLNALGLIVQNLKDAYTYGELDRDYLERTVQKSMAQIQHMSKTIDDFRDFFQPDKEKIVFDTMQALGNVLSLFSAQLAANDISFRLTCHTHRRTFRNVADIAACADKTARGFRNEFEHVMLNLINNARDAILEKRGAGKAADQGSMHFDFFSGEGKIMIKASDNGGGIAPDVIGRVFEPYFTTKGPAKGTGLGLYMSKVIIEEHMGGKLFAENDAGGAVFTIELPQAGVKHG